MKKCGTVDQRKGRGRAQTPRPNRYARGRGGAQVRFLPVPPCAAEAAQSVMDAGEGFWLRFSAPAGGAYRAARQTREAARRCAERRVLPPE